MATPSPAKIGVIGAGAAGLITAHTLLRDGFEHVEVLTRDPSAGGVWAAKRVYPGLSINNVHGEFRFSPLQMPPPANASATGGRLAGEDMTEYMETFAETFLSGSIRYNTEVLKISRSQDRDTDGWVVVVRDLNTQNVESIVYDKLVLCTGGCSEPNIPEALTVEKAKKLGFTGPVLHSTQFASRLDEVYSAGEKDGVVVVGGGKSAQDVSANLARRGIRVSMVFTASDAVMATPIPYPAVVRKSRLLSVLSPHAELNTSLERFLHTTWLGALLVRAMWAFLTWVSFWTLAVPPNSPLRNTPSLFWTVRTNDEGTGRKDGFHALVNEGKIELVAPARAAGYAADGNSVVLEDGRTIRAGAVVLATGFRSSWNGIFDEEIMEDLGLGRHATTVSMSDRQWAYTSLPDTPSSSSKQGAQAPSLYRGIVPAKNILRRDLVVNGAIFTTNNGYVFEVVAHWISSYFLGDPFLQLPSTPADAMAWADRNAAWLRKRYPGTFAYANESWSGDLAFWSWPQLVDGLLADMQLRTTRSGGNAVTWPLKVIDLEEIKYLKEERDSLRAEIHDDGIRRRARH